MSVEPDPENFIMDGRRNIVWVSIRLSKDIIPLAPTGGSLAEVYLINSKI